MKRRFLALPAARAAVSGAAVVAVSALASGCAMFNPVTTNLPYEPADGVSANVGDLAIRDLVLVGRGEGKAVVSGGAINLGETTLTVQFQAAPAQGQAPAAGGSEITLKPREQIDLAAKGLVLEDVKAKSGSIVPVSVVSQSGDAAVVNVPLLPPVGYYTTVTPPAAP